MSDRPLVSGIVVSYGTRELTLDAVESLFAFLPAPSEVWVVDNASPDGSAEAVRERFPEAKVIDLDENVGFGRANNVAMRRARGDWLLLLNSDARLVDREAVARMIERMREDPKLGVVGPRLENDEGRLERSARSFPSLSKEIVRRWGLYLLVPRPTVGEWLLGDFWAPGAARVVDWVTGACMLVRREAYEQTGGFDERIFMYGEELEWAWRLNRLGWKTLYDPSITVVHRRASSGDEGSWRVLSALEGDVRVFRWTHGPLRTLALNLIRLSGFLLEAMAFGAISHLRRSAYVRSRGRQAEEALHRQLQVVTRYPFG